MATPTRREIITAFAAAACSPLGATDPARAED